MKKKTLSLIMSATILAAIATGCGKPAATEVTSDTSVEETPATTDAAETPETTEAATVQDTEEQDENAVSSENEDTIMDRNGNMITLPEKTETIVSMSPSTTQILIDFGLGESIKAVDTYSAMSFSDELPADILQFDMMEPDNEALVALEPDIVFTSGMSDAGGVDAFQSVRDAGICVADIPSSTSFAEIAEDMKFIGSAVGEDVEAAALIEEFNNKHEMVEKLGKDVTEKKKILFMISLPSAEYPSIYTFGKGTYLDEMITDIGAENVTGDQEGWISITEEEAIAMNPDVIITNIDYIDDVVNVIKSTEGWGEVNAIKNDAVYYIDATTSNQPNNHTVDALIQMAKLVYPDVFDVFEDPFASPSDAE